MKHPAPSSPRLDPRMLEIATLRAHELRQEAVQQAGAVLRQACSSWWQRALRRLGLSRQEQPCLS